VLLGGPPAHVDANLGEQPQGTEGADGVELGEIDIRTPLHQLTGVVSTILRRTGWDEQSADFGFCHFAWGEVLRALKRVCEP